MTGISMLCGESPRGVVTDELKSDLQVSHREVWERPQTKLVFWFSKYNFTVKKYSYEDFEVHHFCKSQNVNGGLYPLPAHRVDQFRQLHPLL